MMSSEEKVLIRVGMVEDDVSYLEMMRSFLDGEEDFCAVGFFGDGESAVEGVGGERPDVMLVDLNLPEMSGIACIERIKREYPEVQILVLTAFEESDLVFDALRMGASGYLLKRELFSEIAEAIRQVFRGGAPMTSVIARKVVDFFQMQQDARNSVQDADMEGLTDRENQVLRLLAKGDAYKMIANDLEISIDTVRMHIRHIYYKLEVHSRGEAVAKYFGR